MAKTNEEIYMEIRMRYEKGESQKDLAILYNIPLPTLKSRIARDKKNGDPWIKGSRKAEKYCEFTEENKKAKEEIIQAINNSAREELEHLEELEKKRRRSEKNLLEPYIDKDIEKGFNTRIENIGKKLELKRNIEDIYTPQEEALIEKVRVETELKRIEIQNKAADLELKTAQNKFYLKKR